MRVVVCNSQELYGDAMKSLLSHQGNFDVVGVTPDPKAATKLAREQHAGGILCDANGITNEQLQFLLGVHSVSDLGLVFVTDQDSDLDLSETELKYVLRTAPAKEMFQAIRATNRQPPQRGRPPGGKVPTNEFELSRREFEVASLVAKGFSNRRISEVVSLKEQSVKNLVSVIMRKMRCENRTQVALKLSKARVEDA